MGDVNKVLMFYDGFAGDPSFENTYMISFQIDLNLLCCQGR